MPLLRDGDVVRVELPVQGEWVDVKRQLSRGDEVAVQRAIMRGARIEAGNPIATLDAEVAIEAAEFATLDVAIKAWSFAEAVTPEAIRALDGESIDAIKERLNELYPAARTDDDRKNLSAPGLAQSSAEEPIQLKSPGSQSWTA